MGANFGGGGGVYVRGTSVRRVVVEGRGAGLAGDGGGATDLLGAAEGAAAGDVGVGDAAGLPSRLGRGCRPLSGTVTFLSRIDGAPSGT